MTYASVCDGIGAVHVAWGPLGWRCAWTSEIDPFPAAVVEHRHGLPNLGDMTKITEADCEQYGPIDLLVGGTPCQSFSVAGLRRGLNDPRGNLALVYLRLAERLRPRWIVWENVPGALSSSGGRDFGSFLGALGQLGYGFAYRVLDAQFYGVAQRRRRVFVVGHLGDWRLAAAVLFDCASLSGDSPPRREAGAGVARPLTASTGGCSGKEQQHTFIGGGKPLNAVDGDVAHTLRADGFDASEDGTGRGTPLVPVAARTAQTSANGHGVSEEVAHTLDQANGPAICFQTRFARNGRGAPDDIAPTLAGADAGATSDMRPCVATTMAVRRLTPRECERLQGFPDDYTAIGYRSKPAADGPRYKALGNSMAVPVMRWIGERIERLEATA